jgi:hypothetical protein
LGIYFKDNAMDSCWWQELMLRTIHQRVLS